MAQGKVIQGRNITVEEIGVICDLMAEHRDWGRTRLSEELCSVWSWRNDQVRIKGMAARKLLLKLAEGSVRACCTKRVDSLAHA